jgi:hypothetical protein
VRIDGIVWVLLGVLLYLALAPFMLNWLNEHGYIDIDWPTPRRTDDDRGDTGTRPGPRRDESRRELRRIHQREDGQ